jgi:hypothetical protein
MLSNNMEMCLKFDFLRQAGSSSRFRPLAHQAMQTVRGTGAVGFMELITDEDKLALSSGMLQFDCPERWWQSSLFSGDAYKQGVFYLSHELTISAFLQLLQRNNQTQQQPSQNSSPRDAASDGSFYKNVLRYVQSISNTTDVHSLEEPRTIDFFSGRVARVSCGYHSMALVSELGELHIQAPLEMFPAVLGRYIAPEDWKGYFTIEKLLGRRVQRVECGMFFFVALTDSNEVITWGVNLNPFAATAEESEKPGSRRDRNSGSPASSKAGNAADESESSSASGSESSGLKNSGVQVMSPRSRRVVTPPLALVTSVAAKKQQETHLLSGHLGHSNDLGPPRIMKGFTGKVLHVGCGVGHFAILTTDGLFTCGTDSKGQLGHSKGPEMSIVPRLGSTQAAVAHVACGAVRFFHQNTNGYSISNTDLFFTF